MYMSWPGDPMKALEETTHIYTQEVPARRAWREDWEVLCRWGNFLGILSLIQSMARNSSAFCFLLSSLNGIFSLWAPGVLRPGCHQMYPTQTLWSGQSTWKPMRSSAKINGFGYTRIGFLGWKTFGLNKKKKNYKNPFYFGKSFICLQRPPATQFCIFLLVLKFSVCFSVSSHLQNSFS